MTEVYIIRHAQAEGNIYRRFQGQSDTQLTALGRSQVAALEKRFQGVHIDQVWSSDLIRAKDTAAAIYGPRGLTLHTKPELREVYFGQWENMPFGQLFHDRPQLQEAFNHRPVDFACEGAESFLDLGKRMVKAVTDIAAANDGKAVAIVSHGWAILSLLYMLFGRGDGDTSIFPSCGNTGVSRLIYENGSFTADYICDSSHLGEPQKKSFTGKNDMWFQPLGDNEGWRYVEFRRDAWQLIYGSLDHFDGSDYLLDARRTTAGEPDALVLCCLGPDIAGLLQLNPHKGMRKGVGYIPFVYLREKYRNKGLGVQLIGYAIWFYRARGRKKLQLRVAPDNAHAIHFYEKLGFYKAGRDSDIMGGTYIMEMEI